MSDPIDIKYQRPKEWEEVLGLFEPDKYGRRIALAHWFRYSSGVIMWSRNGTNWGGIKPPTHWWPLPQIPEGL